MCIPVTVVAVSLYDYSQLHLVRATAHTNCLSNMYSFEQVAKHAWGEPNSATDGQTGVNTETAGAAAQKVQLSIYTPLHMFRCWFVTGCHLVARRTSTTLPWYHLAARNRLYVSIY
jgi:hypothetical protein